MMVLREDTKTNIKELELDLEALLKPVQPRPEFVSDLYQNLLIYPKWKIVVPSVLKFVIIIMAAIISGLLVIVTGARAIFMLIGTMKIFRDVNFGIKKG